ncbi:Pre-rRNA-processing protein TSR2-domain-containing protein [Stachybotrys elegans]|uniref:Pre-rRNA-processing protein TSR2-domain-containing protein n=1 Tax=Stachybotrys elegans TaxID=80388 RepID=A0A8K0SKQ9_9HYPO|nr:Pre-rRNA-processing protein TSR2-domain-containing protein [Stachybotrys elegans]
MNEKKKFSGIFRPRHPTLHRPTKTMASATTTLPPAATRQSQFEQGVAYALHLWPALTLSVQSGWGGPDSEDKRSWFAGAVVELFPEFTDAPPTQSDKKNPAPQEPDVEDVETVLLQVMCDEFEVNVDDDSAMEVAGQIIRARTQCALGQYDEVNSLKERFENRKGKKVDQLFKKAEDADQDTDWESDDSGDSEDGDEDVNMDEAPALVSVPKEKPAPEVDEDGFTKVTRKR